MEFVKYHLPVILYGATVLALSSIPNLRSPEIRFLAGDKLAHFIEYAVFALLASRSTSHLHRRVSAIAALLLALLLLAVFAVVDEVLQGFIPGRQADFWDYLADLAGGSLVLVILWLRKR